MIAGSIQKLLSETFGLPADTNAQEDAVAAESTDTMEETLERRYDVFVSSTYEDLKEERKEITQAILECDCIPVGMEMFPASNTEQWKFIQKVIDRADFYLVVIAGKYGFVMKDTGKSYTEMEFDYATEKGKPKENAALSAKIRETTNSLEQINETFSALEKQVSQSLHSLKI